MTMNNYLFVYKCVIDHNGVWPSYCERYLHWDETIGWNFYKGESVYYSTFSIVCDSLGIEFRYGDK